MGVANRDFDVSEKNRVFNFKANNTVTGSTYMLGVVPYQSQLFQAVQAVNGISGSPNHSIWVQRFIAGAGITSFAVGASLVSVAYGTSGCQTFGITNTASNLLQTGDVLMLAVAASNAAVLEVSVGLVLQALQDIKSEYGVTP